jgi:hypothetical protein
MEIKMNPFKNLTKVTHIFIDYKDLSVGINLPTKEIRDNFKNNVDDVLAHYSSKELIPLMEHLYKRAGQEDRLIVLATLLVCYAMKNKGSINDLPVHARLGLSVEH